MDRGTRQADIGVIGGTGLYELPELTDRRTVEIETPYGPPSDAVLIGRLGDRRLAFLPRHGRQHLLSPAEVNGRANLWALKALGVRAVMAFSAVGSLREAIRPLDVVLPDQLFDRTDGRPRTFFGDGLVAHVGMAEPFCDEVRRVMLDAARAEGGQAHDGGTYICIEGPQYSTRAESRLYRSWGFDVIGMTAVPEARLAREAELPYAVMALVSDWDVWHESEEPVSAELVLANLARSVELARRVVVHAAARLDFEALAACPCSHSLRAAFNSPLHLAPADVKQALAPIIGRYLRDGA